MAWNPASGKRDLMNLGAGLYAVGRDQNKAELCRCDVPWQHKPNCIWWTARKFLTEVQKVIARLDLDD